jgi:hypothetical protein
MDQITPFEDITEAAAEPPPRTLDMEIDVTFQKRRFTNLHLEEPTAKQLEKAEMELNAVNVTAYQMRRYQIAMIAAVAGVPREVVLELRNGQLQEAFDFLLKLLGPTPKDGET